MFKSLGLALFLVVASGTASGEMAVVTVPVQYVRHELLVQVHIGNRGPYTFLVDTDTTPSLIDAGVARQLGLYASRMKVPIQIVDLRVGPVRQDVVFAIPSDFSGMSAKFGRRVDGVLGTSFLDGRVVQINYRCPSIAFLPNAVVAPFTARFRGVDENLTNDVWVGSQRITATFDTGNAGSILVTASGIRDLRLESVARHGRVTTWYGYYGAAAGTEAALTGVRIGDVDVATPRAWFIPSLERPFDVNVGNQILDRYLVTFDYPRGLVTLQAPEACGGGSRPSR